MPPRPNEHVLANGNGIHVTTHGPGRLHLFTYGSAPAGIQSYNGFLATKSAGISHFVIGKSYGYTHFAFFWDGKGKAEYSVGQLPQKHRVGHSWATSSFWVMGYWYILPVEVTAVYFKGSVNSHQNVNIYRIPEDWLTE